MAPEGRGGARSWHPVARNFPRPIDDRGRATGPRLRYGVLMGGWATRRQFSRGAAVWTTAAVVGLPRVVQAGRVDLMALDGEYAYSGGQREREHFAAVVEDLVAGLNALLRPIARKKLLDSQAPSSSVVIKIRGGEVEVMRKGKPRFGAPIDGPAIDWKNQYGSTFKIRARSDGNRTLKLEFVGASSRSLTTYKLGDDGGRMRMKTRIADPRLPKVLRFGFSYRRRQAG
jgi:hypothetical protein